MPALPLKRLLSSSAMLAVFFLLFAGTTVAMFSQPGPASLLPWLGLTLLAAVGALAIKRLSVRALEAEMALAEAERYIEAVAELSQDIHTIIEARSRSFLYLNSAVADLLGYPQEEFIKGGLGFLTSLVHPEDLPAVMRQYEMLVSRTGEAGAKEEAREQVFRIRDHRGEYRWFKSRMSVFVRFHSGRPAELLAVIQDVTEQRRYEAALLQAQRHESLGAVARSTMHDLNNTLMGIQGFTEIALGDGGQPELLRESLEKVHASMQRASALCRQMEDYAGIGRIQIAPRQLNDAVREALPSIESMIPRGSRLRLDLEPDLPLAGVDLNQARYALLNLVYDAAEALRIAGGEITVRTRVQAPEGTAPEFQGAYVCLEVRNTGPGRAPEIMADRYDPLFAAKWPGNGLGLAAVQAIMREHRGAVAEAAGEGAGATQLFFPLAGKLPELDAELEAAPVAGGAGVILLADDEPTVRAILRQGLERAGFQVIEAEDGVDGIKAFLRHRSSLSLALLDLTMPHMGGDAMFEEIQKLAPNLPVVLMSGYSESEATSALSCKGLAGFLSKPCSIKDALAVVHKALAGPRPAANVPE